MKKYIIAGNWKMHKTIKESEEFIFQLNARLISNPYRQILLCVPFTMLHAASEAAQNSPIQIGAQNMHFEEKGAFTGEISPVMLKDAGSNHTLIGHSERRILFGETNEDINKKIKAALKFEIMPILCVGESLEEREAGKLQSVLQTQVEKALDGVSATDVEKIVIAYEPIWAIGTGKTASAQDANYAHEIIRNILEKKYNAELAKNMLILYGGSVNPDNIAQLMCMPDINGALVGGASLDVESFTKLVNFTPRKSCGFDDLIHS